MGNTNEIPVLIEAVNIDDKGAARLEEHSLRMIEGILSGPEFEDFLSWLHAFRTQL